jgi:hypothetical protein
MEFNEETLKIAPCFSIYYQAKNQIQNDFQDAHLVLQQQFRRHTAEELSKKVVGHNESYTSETFSNSLGCSSS